MLFENATTTVTKPFTKQNEFYLTVCRLALRPLQPTQSHCALASVPEIVYISILVSLSACLFERNQILKNAEIFHAFLSAHFCGSHTPFCLVELPIGVY